MKKVSKKKAPAKKAAPKTKASAKMKPAAGAKAKPKKKTSRIRSAARKTREILDQSLSQFSPGLRNTLEGMKGQWVPGDLRSIGWKALERARDISDKVKATAVRKTKTIRRTPAGRNK